jgi:hypothetical protein
MGTRGSFLGVKRPEREADHPPPSSAQVKNAWRYTSSSPQYVLMAWCLVKAKEQFYLYLYLQSINYEAPHYAIFSILPLLLSILVQLSLLKHLQSVVTNVQIIKVN